MKTIIYSAKAANVKILGPGNRAVLWVHGCCFACDGCIGGNYKTGEGMPLTTKDAADWFLSTHADGLTISGGEPMLQAEALSEMIYRIRNVRDCGVIVYSGFTYEDLLRSDDPGIAAFLERIDLLIDGPYVKAKDIGQPYRGSSNQRLLTFTDRYKTDIDEYYNAGHARQMDIRVSKEQTLMIGVPSKAQAEIWQRIKQLGGK